MTETPSAWVGSLSAYNEGRLLGDWFDGDEIPTTAEEWVKGIKLTDQEIYAGVSLNPTEHEELWVFDHDGFRGLLRGECSPIAARQLAELIEDAEGDHVEPEALAAWADHVGIDLEGKDWPDVRDDFFDAWSGEFDDREDFAYHIADDLLSEHSDLPDTLLTYFDHAKFARDLFIGDYYSERSPGGGVYVFRNI